MAALVIRSLNILLGIFFTFLGTLKITPAISRDLHKDLRSEYAKFARVLPGARLAGVKVPSKWYRRSVGTIEIVCGESESLCPPHVGDKYTRHPPRCPSHHAVDSPHGQPKMGQSQVQCTSIHRYRDVGNSS